MVSQSPPKPSSAAKRAQRDLLPKYAELSSPPVFHTVVTVLWRNLLLIYTTLKYCYSLV